MNGTQSEELVLELLANGPSSFAALYGFLARQNAEGRPRVAEILELMVALEKRGWVRALRVTADGAYAAVTDADRARAEREYREWLEAPMTDLSVDALSIDEVGLWLEMQEEGRVNWESRSEARDSRSHWTLDQDEATQTIVVYAGDAGAAELALENWLRTNPGIELLIETRDLRSVSEFRLRDGTVFAGGVRLQSRYRERQ